MSREWNPGDVALVTNERRVENVAICQVAPGGALWQYGVAYASDRVDLGRPARRLVVIDPEDREQVERFVRLNLAAFPKFVVGLDPNDQARTDRLYVDAAQSALREFANPTPPKPSEPIGLGAVVEDANGHKFVRVAECYDGWAKDHDWQRIGGELNAVRNFGWASLDAVKVLSGGVVA